MTTSIKRIEMGDFLDEPANCPFCGKRAIIFSECGSAYHVEPCPHMLFACHDDGWDYLSERAIDNLTSIGYNVSPEWDVELKASTSFDKDDDHTIDHITDRITIKGAIKLASYHGAPSLYGAYAGFAPLPEEEQL